MASSTAAKAKPVFCVLGAGCSGLSAAGVLALKGCEVRLYDHSPQPLERIRQLGGIQVVAREGGGLPHGDAQIRVATSDIAQAMEGADVLLVAVEATGYAFLARRCAPYVRPGQTILLSQGGLGGALEFHYILREHGIREQALVTEAQAPLLDSRLVNPGQVHLFGIRRGVPLAALPARRVSEALAALRPALPELVESESVLQIGIDQIDPVLAPALCVLDAARPAPGRGGFGPAREGIGRPVGQVLHALDAERMAVGAALGLHCFSARDWLYLAHGASGRTLHEALRARRAGDGGRFPDARERLLSADVSAGLVPLASLGEALGAPCPTMRAIIHLAGLMHGRDYWQEGRTVRRMGLEGLSAAQIRRLAHDGVSPDGGREPIFGGRERAREPRHGAAQGARF